MVVTDRAAALTAPRNSASETSGWAVGFQRPIFAGMAFQVMNANDRDQPAAAAG
jgi:hypothetical protein